MIHTIKFKIQEGISGNNSFGFITKDFTLWTSKSWNPGKNGSMFASSNGFFVTSSCFDSKLEKHQSCASHARYSNGDIVCMKIDTKNMRAMLWNVTATKMDDLEFDSVISA